MKGITIQQPFASLIAMGKKTIETRAWRTDYRGPLAIHAAAGLGAGGMRALEEHCYDAAVFLALTEKCSELERSDHMLRALFKGQGRRKIYTLDGRVLDSSDGPAAKLPRGVIVAVATLASIRTAEEVPEEALEREGAFGVYRSGMWAWKLTGVRALPVPVECKGAQSLWDVPPEVLRKLPRVLP